jgi:hypothetical protein
VQNRAHCRLQVAAYRLQPAMDFHDIVTKLTGRRHRLPQQLFPHLTMDVFPVPDRPEISTLQPDVRLVKHLTSSLICCLRVGHRLTSSLYTCCTRPSSLVEVWSMSGCALRVYIFYAIAEDIMLHCPESTSGGWSQDGATD